VQRPCGCSDDSGGGVSLVRRRGPILRGRSGWQDARAAAVAPLPPGAGLASVVAQQLLRCDEAQGHTSMTILLDMTREPATTASRSVAHSRSTGADSPVMADSSTIATPSISLPSHGITPPASITTRSPRMSSEAGLVRPSKSVATASTCGMRGRSGRPWRCRPLKSLPIRTNRTPETDDRDHNGTGASRRLESSISH